VTLGESRYAFRIERTAQADAAGPSIELDGSVLAPTDAPRFALDGRSHAVVIRLAGPA
jgi:hypothetical protein